MILLTTLTANARIAKARVFELKMRSGVISRKNRAKQMSARRFYNHCPARMPLAAPMERGRREDVTFIDHF